MVSRRALLLLSWLAACMAGVSSCSSIRVKTEVFVPSLSALSDAAIAVDRDLSTLESRVQALARPAAAAWAAAMSRSPVLVGDPGTLARDYVDVLSTVLKREATRITKIRAEAQQLSTSVGDAQRDDGDARLRDPSRLLGRALRLKLRYSNLLSDLEFAFDQVTRENVREIVQGAIGGVSITRPSDRKPEDGLPAEQLAVWRNLAKSAAVEAKDKPTYEDVEAAMSALAAPSAPILQLPLVSLGGVTDVGVFAAMREVAESSSAAVRIPMGSPNLAEIVGASEGRWAKYYNRVVGETMFGNAEIAIKMVTPGVYSMKGVTFDPSEVQKAVLDGVESTVSLAAAVYGAGLSLPATGGASDSGAGASTAGISKARLRASEHDIARRRLARGAAREALFTDLVTQLRALESKVDQPIPADLVTALAKRLRLGADAIEGSNAQAP